jgi:ATPases of the AAA+ class
MIMHDSILIDQPDECYADELWNDKDTFHSIRDELLGRSAKEICFLGHHVKVMKRNELGGLVAFNVRNAILEAMNREEKLDVFRSSSQRFSSNLIPKTQWDDIGGLSYVREEIIDAIELPLKYPKLFAKTRRSGILFFRSTWVRKNPRCKSSCIRMWFAILIRKGARTARLVRGGK